MNAPPSLATRPLAANRLGDSTVRHVIMLASRAEAVRLCRNPLVMASLAISAALIWWNSRNIVPQWWVWDMQVGSSLLPVAGAVLVATQFTAGRIRRDDVTQLYESYPTPASARTFAQLLGLSGPLALAALLVGAAILWLDLLGPVGMPRPVVLAQGLMLIVLAGAAGVALGTWLPHPMTGILVVMLVTAAETDLLLPFSAPVQLPGGTAWLFPWSQPVVLRWLPGPVAMIPPGTHLAWLAALTCLGVVIAFWGNAFRRPSIGPTILMTLITVACITVTSWIGWVQTRPVPVSLTNRLVFDITHPARIERCTSQRNVRYCTYPGLQADIQRWATVVNGVLDRLPRRPAKTLVIRQVVDTDLEAPGLNVGYAPVRQLNQAAAQIAAFTGAETANPHLVPRSSIPPVYVDVNWGARSAVGPYQLDLAIQAAWWIARLPTTWYRTVTYGCGPNCSAEAQLSCLPVGQAREAIALWLAASATPAARSAFLTGLRYGPSASKIGRTWIASYDGPPVAAAPGYIPAVQFTAQGAALATAMLRLPRQQIDAVLARWHHWLNPSATDTQLASALGIPSPALPPPHILAYQRSEPANRVCR